MALSVRAGKTHEVLLTTYLLWVTWLLAGPMIREINRTLGGSLDFPAWLTATDPFTVALATYRPWGAEVGPVSVFLGVCLLASAVLLASAIRDVRRLAIRDPRRPKPRRTRSFGLGWLTRWFPEPPLDAFLLWREWHRNRPTGWSRRVWGLYAIASVIFSVIAVAPCMFGQNSRATWVY